MKKSSGGDCDIHVSGLIYLIIKERFKGNFFLNLGLNCSMDTNDLKNYKYSECVGPDRKPHNVKQQSSYFEIHNHLITYRQIASL